ncbi:hypothetical protein FS749_000688 [Ceratobasidium sp. UAMH 11750]|nr:hypothetical protein FS749_000688 [Ceratobasidium sp. UAMH 11750]
MSAAALVLIWKLWSLAWGVRTNAGVSKEPWWLTVILLGFPYVVWGVEAGIFAVLQAKSRVHKITFYCTSDDPTLGIISGVSAAVLLILCLLFQTWTMIIAYRRYRRSHRLGRAEVGDVSVPFFIRIMSFAVVVFVALILAFTAIVVFSLVVPDTIVSSIGPIMFIIFSSQGDVLAAWRIYRPRPGFTDSESGTSTQHSIQDRPRPPQPTVTEVEIPFARSQESPIHHIPGDLKNPRQLFIHVQQTVFSPEVPSDFVKHSKSAQTLRSLTGSL